MYLQRASIKGRLRARARLAVNLAANGTAPMASAAIVRAVRFKNFIISELPQRDELSDHGRDFRAAWAEAPMDVYGEYLFRTATTDGILMLTFTPLAGLTETVLQFLPDMWLGDS